MVHLYRKEIMVDVSFQQDMVMAHLDLEVAQVDMEVAPVVHVKTMPFLFTENIEEVQQTPTRPLGTPLRVDHTGGMIQKRSTLLKALN